VRKPVTSPEPTVEIACLRLFITGKASVARAIALALSSRQPLSKQNTSERPEGYFQVAGDCVTWTGGHLLELAGPEKYDELFRQWRLDNLPIIPRQLKQHEWKYLERKTQAAQLAVIRKLLSQAEQVIHAGDPDREGQWMVDEVLDYLHNTKVVQRMLVHNLNSNALRKVLQTLDHSTLSNNNFKSLAISARARSQADWLYGLNMTRAYTLLGRHSGYEGVLSVGRVQTPLLAMVVKRDEAIEQFNPQIYFEMRAKFRHEAELAFLDAPMPEAEFCYANWKHHRGTGLVAEADFYQPIEKKIRGKLGIVTTREEQHHAVTPPLPFNLSALQIECALHFGYSATEVNEICQHLYEDHHLITYPRSDCRYLPEIFVEEVNDVLDAMRKNLPASEKILKEKISGADTWRRSSCWDNKKIKSHHAIIPTGRSIDSKLLNEQQLSVYQMICRYYLAQFFGDKLSTESILDFRVEEEEFFVSRTQVTEAGWQEVISDTTGLILPAAETPRHDFPPWQTGDRIMCEDVDIREKKTRPSLRFTDASLMAAMTSIAPFVASEEIKNDLHDHDGLGTESTRASIIETLFRRGYLMKGSKNIFSTPIGRDLIHALPAQATQVDMTARWEKTLHRIADMDSVDADQAADRFMQDVEQQITIFMEYARHQKNMVVTSPDEILGLARDEKFHCPKCQSLLVQRNGKNGFFWGCSSYPECKTTAADRVDKNGKHVPDFIVNHAVKNAINPTIPKNVLKKNCPDCGKPLVKRKGKRGEFAGCSAYPICTHTEPLL
jgi:DNA topoisomerase III